MDFIGGPLDSVSWGRGGGAALMLSFASHARTLASLKKKSKESHHAVALATDEMESNRSGLS